MAISTLVTRKRLVAGKIEATPGTPIALASADATLPFYDPALKYTIPMNRRKAPGSATDFTGVPGPRQGQFTGQTHLFNVGTGTDPVWASVFLACCGFIGAAGTYTPVTGSAAANSATIGLFQSGRLKTIIGAAGTFVIKGSAGNPCTIDWTFTGKWAAPTSTAILTPTYTALVPPRFAGATLTIGATPYKVSDFELDMGNKVALVEDCTDATGYLMALVTDREPKLSVKLMATTAKDFYADHVGGVEAAFICAVGAGTNNVVTLTANKAQLTDPPEDADHDGYLEDSLTFQLNRNGADDSELSIAFS